MNEGLVALSTCNIAGRLVISPNMTDEELPRTKADELHAAVRGGTRAVLAGQIGAQLISLVVLGVLMRLVAPEDYGLLAMALPALMLPRMAATLGTGVTTVQGAGLTAGQLNWLFSATVFSGATAAVVTAMLGPLLAWGYAQPLLVPLCAALAGSTLVAALGTQHQALLERELKLAALARLRLLAQATGGAAGIAAAWRGWGVWALVVQQYGELLVLSAGSWLLEPWRPGLPRRGERVVQILQTSGFYSLSTLVVYASQNLEKVLFPLLLGPAASRALGLYSQAFSLLLRPVYLVTVPLFTVLLPALSRSRGDARLTTQLTVKFFRLAAIVLFPCGMGLAVVAPEAMLVLGGDDWRAAGTLLALLAPAIPVLGFFNLASCVFAAAGRTGKLLAAALVLLLIVAQALFAGYLLGKLVTPPAEWEFEPILRPALGMAFAYAVVIVVVLFIPYLTFCFRSVGISLGTVLGPLWPALFATLLMGLVVASLRQLLVVQGELPLPLRLLALILAGVLSYALLARRELHWFWSEITTLGVAEADAGRSARLQSKR